MKLFISLILTGCLLMLFSPCIYAIYFEPKPNYIRSNFEFSGKNVELQVKPNPHLVFLFHNISDKKIILNPVLNSPGASAGYTSTIDGGNWSALNLGHDLTFHCAIHDDERIRYISCNQVLQIYHYPAVQFPTKNQGDFWIGENKSREQIDVLVKNHQLKNKN